MKMEMTGGAVIALAGLVVVAGGVYWTRKKLGTAADVLTDIVTAPVRAISAVTNAVPPGMTIKNSDGSTVAAATGEQVKSYNVNPINFGMGVGSWGFGMGSTTEAKPSSQGGYNYDPDYFDKLLSGQMTLDDYLTPPPEWSAVGGYK